MPSLSKTLWKLGKRLIGLTLAIVAFILTCTIYYKIPYRVRFPVIILAIPLVAAVAGLFQAISGLTIFQANAELPSMPPLKKFLVILLALALLTIASYIFIMFVITVES